MLFEVSWCLRSYRIVFWGTMVTSARSENYKNEGLDGFLAKKIVLRLGVEFVSLVNYIPVIVD